MKKIIPFKPSKPSLTSIVMGVLAEWSRIEKQESLSRNSVYYGFSKLANRHSRLFDGLYFSGSKKSPISKKLEDILFMLGAGYIITIGGPMAGDYNISRDAKENTMKELIQEYGNGFGRIIQKLVREFKNNVRIYKEAYEQ